MWQDWLLDLPGPNRWYQLKYSNLGNKQTSNKVTWTRSTGKKLFQDSQWFKECRLSLLEFKEQMKAITNARGSHWSNHSLGPRWCSIDHSLGPRQSSTLRKDYPFKHISATMNSKINTKSLIISQFRILIRRAVILAYQKFCWNNPLVMTNTIITQLENLN